MAEGVLTELARWPVKSLGGEALGAARLDWRGLGGDRAHALLDQREGREGRWLTVRQAPRMLAWSAAYPDAPDDQLDPADPPPPTLRAPDGTAWGWDAPGLEEALAARSSCAASAPTCTWSWTRRPSPRSAGRAAASRSARPPWRCSTPASAA